MRYFRLNVTSVVNPDTMTSIASPAALKYLRSEHMF
jgi:hypothetical protein